MKLIKLAKRFRLLRTTAFGGGVDGDLRGFGGLINRGYGAILSQLPRQVIGVVAVVAVVIDGFTFAGTISVVDFRGGRRYRSNDGALFFAFGGQIAIIATTGTN